MKYRPHRGSLDASMAECVELHDRASLIEHLAGDLKKWGLALGDEDVRVEPYGRDDRIGWDAHIVLMRNKQTKSGIWYFGAMGPKYFGALGFTDIAVGQT